MKRRKRVRTVASVSVYVTAHDNGKIRRVVSVRGRRGWKVWRSLSRSPKQRREFMALCRRIAARIATLNRRRKWGGR